MSPELDPISTELGRTCRRMPGRLHGRLRGQPTQVLLAHLPGESPHAPAHPADLPPVPPGVHHYPQPEAQVLLARMPRRIPRGPNGDPDLPRLREPFQARRTVRTRYCSAVCRREAEHRRDQAWTRNGPAASAKHRQPRYRPASSLPRHHPRFVRPPASPPRSATRWSRPRPGTARTASSPHDRLPAGHPGGRPANDSAPPH